MPTSQGPLKHIPLTMYHETHAYGHESSPELFVHVQSEKRRTEIGDLSSHSDGDSKLSLTRPLKLVRDTLSISVRTNHIITQL